MNERAKRLAVVIGNSDYEHENLEHLENPTKDAKAIQDSLRTLGFDVTSGFNLQRNEMLKRFNGILDSLEREASDIVLYYSGHGVSIDGKMYIAPVDAENDYTKELIKLSFLAVDEIVKLFLRHRKDDNIPIIVILDCCRSKFTSENTHDYEQDPLEEFGKQTNIAMLYSTANGEFALDGTEGSKHSPYTEILLENITKDCTINEIHSIITRTLGQSSRFSGKQVSWMNQCLYQPYRFFLRQASSLQEHFSVPSSPKDTVEEIFYRVPAMNNDFIDRPNIIKKIETALADKHSLGESRILALTGLGGMGKTQLMLYYCYHHRLAYDYVFWLEADGRIMTLDSFRKLAINLGLDEASAKEKYTEEKIISWVCAWLQKKTRWLLLLDNIDEVMVTKIFEILPRIGGDIILTTREPIPSAKAKVIPVDKMDEAEALSLLLGDLSLKEDQRDEQFRYAKEIIVELDSMPLVIDLARACINSMKIPIKNYLNKLRNQRDILSYHTNINPQQYVHTVATVWQPSFERVRTQNPIAGMILDVCAFLQPDAIPVKFLECQYSVLRESIPISPSPSLESGENSWEMVRAAIALLVDFSLVSNDSSGDTLTIHRLVQKVILNMMGDEQKTRWARNLAAAFDKEIKFSDSYAPVTRTIMDMYLPHIHHFTTMLNKDLLLSVDLHNLLVRTVDYLLDNGIYIGVEELAKVTVSISESIHGPENPSTVKSLSCLGRFYTERGKYAEAEALYKRTLAINEKAFVPEHPETAISLNDLASLYVKEGRYSDAEPLYRSALSICEKVFGHEHPQTAISMNDLASLCQNQGKYADAKRLYQCALEIRKKTLGPVHPKTAISLNNLAELYYEQSKYAEAKLLYQHALKIAEETLGPEHPETATPLNNLAKLYCKQGDYVSAEGLYKRALTIRRKVLGSEHPDVATSLNDLGFLYYKQKNGDAESLYKQALLIYENALGSDHPNTAISYNNLALLYYDQAKYVDAKSLFQQALNIWEKALGSEHPNTATTLNNLAKVYHREREYIRAEKLYRQVLKIREEVLGSEHPDTATSLSNLASLFDNQDKYTNAESLYQMALTIRKKALGSEHPDTTTSLNNLALLYYKQKRYADAEPLFLELLAIYEKVEPNHPNIFTFQSNLGLLYYGQEMYVDAELRFRLALNISEKTLGLEHPNTATTLNNLARVYHKKREYIRAKPLYQQALTIREATLGSEHPDTVVSLINLASLFDNQDEYANAEPLYQRALMIRKKVLGSEHLDIATTLNSLALLYHRQKRYADARLLFQQALAIYEKHDHSQAAIIRDQLASLSRNSSRFCPIS